MHKCNARALFLGEMLRDNQGQPLSTTVISIITFHVRVKITVNLMYLKRIHDKISNTIYAGPFFSYKKKYTKKYNIFYSSQIYGYVV